MPGRGWRAGVPWAWVPSQVSCRACPAVMPGMGWRTGSWAWMPPQVSCRLCPACRAREGMARGSALGMGAVGGFLPALPRCHARNGMVRVPWAWVPSQASCRACPACHTREGMARGSALGGGCRRRFPAGLAPLSCPEWGGARGPGHGCRRRFPAGFAPHAVPGRGWRAGVPWAWVPSQVSCRLCPACHARNGVAHGVLGMDAAAGFLPALPRMPYP